MTFESSDSSVAPQHSSAFRNPWLLVFALAVCLGTAFPSAAAPAWWDNGVFRTEPGTTADDYAVINQGQLKNVATEAWNAIRLKIQAGEYPQANAETLALPEFVDLEALVAGFEQNKQNPGTDDYTTMNIGQLKNVAAQVYDCLRILGVESRYPWGRGSAVADDFALANIGQLKTVFNFDLRWDDDGDGLPNWWEKQANQFGLDTLDSHPPLLAPLPGTSPSGSPSSTSNNNVPQVDPDGYPFSVDVRTGYFDEMLDDWIGTRSIYTLSWSDLPAEAPPIKGYAIYQLTESEIVHNRTTWQQIASLEPDQRSFEIGVSYGDRYYWRVVAFTDDVQFSGPEIVVTPRREYRVTGGWTQRTTPVVDKAVNINPALFKQNETGTFFADRHQHGNGPDKIIQTTVGAAIVSTYPQLVLDVESEYYPIGKILSLCDRSKTTSSNPKEKKILGDAPARGPAFVKVDPPSGNDEGDVFIAVETIDAQISKGTDSRKPEPEVSEESVPLILMPNESALLFVEGPFGFWNVPTPDQTSPINTSEWHDIDIYFDNGLIEVREGNGEWNRNGYFRVQASPVGVGPYEVRFRANAGDLFPGQALIEATIECHLSCLGDIMAKDKVKVALSAPPAMTSADELGGPNYRKIGLTGRPLPDAAPQDKANQGSEPEQTFVDALTLGLRHSTTDVYVPIPGSDLALSVRRDYNPEIWTNETGLRPHERRDRPFGLGWRTNLCCAAEYTDEGVVITDYDGSQHRFVYYEYEPNKYGFVPWIKGVSETESHLSTLEIKPIPTEGNKMACCLPTKPKGRFGLPRRFEESKPKQGAIGAESRTIPISVAPSQSRTA